MKDIESKVISAIWLTVLMLLVALVSSQLTRYQIQKEDSADRIGMDEYPAFIVVYSDTVHHYDARIINAYKADDGLLYLNNRIQQIVEELNYEAQRKIGRVYGEVSPPYYRR